MKVLIISHNKKVQQWFPEIQANSLNDLVLETRSNLNWDNIIDQNYDLIWSMHCIAIIPDHVLSQVRCINLHPGYNPHNRGWNPQVFSIINKRKCGVTIHEIDNRIDHGNIIYQQVVEIKPSDTSFDVYERLLQIEKNLMVNRFDYFCTAEATIIPEHTEGCINYKKDYDKLCKLDLDNVDTLENHIDLLRSLTHQPYKNAYFVKHGKKIFVSICLE